MRNYLIAGNWKMNTTRASAVELAAGVKAGVQHHPRIEVLVCPPFPYISAVADVLRGSSIHWGAQNCWHEQPGAFTGEVSLDMLKDLGCTHVILGHSERRHILHEPDDVIGRKVVAAIESGLTAILCVGELLAEREANQTESVLDRQMKAGLANVSASQTASLVVAYEPVWAIGTGKTATPEQAESAHLHLRNWLASRYTSPVGEQVRILYGGSVKPANAGELLSQPNVDGALVGGASLKAADFLGIIQGAVQQVA
jgi:triosephosphate isomerase